MDGSETARRDGVAQPGEYPRRRAAGVAVRSGLGALLVLLIALVLAVDSVWPQGFLYGAVLLAVVALSMHEFSHLAQRVGLCADLRAMVLGGVTLSLVHWGGLASGAFDAWLWSGAVLCALVMGLLVARIVRARIAESVQSVGACALAWVYVPVMLSFLTAVRLEWGVAGVIALLAVCKAGSSGAYFAGSLLGRRKLVPGVSPGKTVAGAAGAIAGAVLVSWGLSVTPLALMGPVAALAFGLVVGTAGIFGDLAESLLKRQAEVKDSGSLLPGFGGMLDMLDDVLFAAPSAFVFLIFYRLLVLGGLR